MQELIPINYDNPEHPTVDGRELHQKLQVATPYHIWFPRQCGDDFVEGKDYCTKLYNRSDGLPGKPRTDHQLTLSMAKQLCMLERTPIGKTVRLYLIAVEEAWNDPDKVMERALQIAHRRALEAERRIFQLESDNAVLTQQVTEMKPKAGYYDVILACPDVIPITTIAKDYGKSAKWLNSWLHEHDVQFRQGDIWLLYAHHAEQGYTSTRTHNFTGKNGDQHAKVHTYWTQKGRLFLYELLKKNGILPIIEEAA